MADNNLNNIPGTLTLSTISPGITVENMMKTLNDDFDNIAQTLASLPVITANTEDRDHPQRLIVITNTTPPVTTDSSHWRTGDLWIKY